MSHTTWVAKTDLHNAFRQVLSSLEENHNSINGLLTSDLYPIQKDTYHFLAQTIRSKTREEHALLSHILNIAYRAEVLSQGAGPLAFALTIGFAKYLFQNNLLNDISFCNRLPIEFNLSLENIRKSLEKHAIAGTLEYLEAGIDMTCQDDLVLAETAKHALHMAGLEGKLFVENGKSSNFFVEHKTGYNFKGKPYKFFLTTNNSLWSASHCKVLIVDGFLEKVSEIDSLLQKCFESKQPMIIVAMGFSEEIVATLKTNQDRKNFECIPVRIMPDIENLNVINDIAVVCGTTPISSLKGEQLCFVKHEDLAVIEHVELRSNDLTIRNSSTIAAVSSQVRNLMEKRAENFAVEDVQTLIDARLKSLISNAVVVHLPNTSKIATDERRVHLDNCFRMAKSIVNYGILPSEPFLKDVSQNITTSFEKAISHAFEYALKNKEWYPALSVLVSYQTSIAGLGTILTSGGMIKLT